MTGRLPCSPTARDPASLPVGFTLISNLGSTSLSPRPINDLFNPAGCDGGGHLPGGPISFANNDGDENPFHLVLLRHGDGCYKSLWPYTAWMNK